MNEKSNPMPMMYKTIPAVAELNKVPGFDPLKFLRHKVSRKTNEEMLQLELPYQKLWFRLRHPQGRMKLTTLRITEQLAIMEARVYLDRSDAEPISSYISQHLLNTILTGIIVRRKEFSLMRSVGMSQKQLSVMVHKEGLIVVGIGLILSVIIGGGIGYVLCSFLKNNLMNYLNYQFPLGITILYCVIVILCSVLITTGALKQQNKLSMMEALR